MQLSSNVKCNSKTLEIDKGYLYHRRETKAEIIKKKVEDFIKIKTSNLVRKSISAI